MAPRKGGAPPSKTKGKPAQPVAQQTTPEAAAAVAAPAPAADAGPEVSLSALKQLEDKRKALNKQLKDVERQIFDLETRYLEGCNPNANALKGYDGLRNQVGSSKPTKTSPVDPADRIFSSSSATAAAK